jgi:hypothetical protein
MKKERSLHFWTADSTDEQHILVNDEKVVIATK